MSETRGDLFKTSVDVASTAPLEVRNEELVRQLRAKFVPLKNKRRRTRTVFSPCALKLLETRFKSHDLYPGSNEISGLAQQIGATEASIQTWFQNKRSRTKKKLDRLVATGTLDENAMAVLLALAKPLSIHDDLHCDRKTLVYNDSVDKSLNTARGSAGTASVKGSDSPIDMTQRQRCSQSRRRCSVAVGSNHNASNNAINGNAFQLDELDPDIQLFVDRKMEPVTGGTCKPLCSCNNSRRITNNDEQEKHEPTDSTSLPFIHLTHQSADVASSTNSTNRFPPLDQFDISSPFWPIVPNRHLSVDQTEFFNQLSSSTLQQHMPAPLPSYFMPWPLLPTPILTSVSKLSTKPFCHPSVAGISWSTAQPISMPVPSIWMSTALATTRAALECLPAPDVDSSGTHRIENRVVNIPSTPVLLQRPWGTPSFDEQCDLFFPHKCSLNTSNLIGGP